MLEMFKKDTTLQREINRVHAELQAHEVGSEEYLKTLTAYERLTLLTVHEKTSSVSPDTKAVVIGNLLGILIIVAYENAHVITTRAFGMFLKTPKG